MKKYLLALLIVPAFVFAMHDTEIVSVSNLDTIGGLIGGVKAREYKWVQVKAINLRWVITPGGPSQAILDTFVFKGFDSGKYTISALLGRDGMWFAAQPDPVTVERLKQKIADFESARKDT